MKIKIYYRNYQKFFSFKIKLYKYLRVNYSKKYIYINEVLSIKSSNFDLLFVKSFNFDKLIESSNFANKQLKIIKFTTSN